MPTPRLSAFTPRYNTTARARPRVVTGASTASYPNPMNNSTRKKNKPRTVSFNSQKEVFPLADTGNKAKNAQNALNQTEARKSIKDVSEPKYKSPRMTPYTAGHWANLLSKHNSYGNTIRNIRNRKNINVNSKLTLEEQAAFMYEPTNNERYLIPENTRPAIQGLPRRSAFSETAARSLIPTSPSGNSLVQSSAPINRKGRRTRRR